MPIILVHYLRGVYTLITTTRLFSGLIQSVKAGVNDLLYKLYKVVILLLYINSIGKG
jgi:hypothetical protein